MSILSKGLANFLTIPQRVRLRDPMTDAYVTP